MSKQLIWTGWEFVDYGVVGYYINMKNGRTTPCVMSYKDLQQDPEKLRSIVKSLKETGETV